jgi:hypothetical protein
MPNAMPLDAIPIWGVLVVAVVVILLAEECGYRFGLFRGKQERKESEPRVGGMVGAELSLLAFLLAFTFGMAGSRFEDRRQVVLDESNAIGTTYLRSAMIPEPQSTEIRRLLREYVDVRIAGVQGGSLEQAIRRSEALHGELWAAAVAVAEKDQRSVPTGLFISSLNETIDLHAKRLQAGLRSRIPPPVWIVLFGVAVSSFLAVGYHGGLTRTARSPAVYLVVLTFAAVMWLIVDLDRPGEGILKVSQQPMIELRKSMEPPSSQ